MGNRRTVPIPKFDEWEEYKPTLTTPQVNPVDTLLDNFLASDKDGISFRCENKKAALSLAGSLRMRMYNNKHGKVLVNQSEDTVYIRRAESNEE